MNTASAIFPAGRRLAFHVFVCGVLLAACGGHDGGSSSISSNAPIITNLRQGVPNVTPRVGGIAPLVFAVDYTDADGDIGQGYCEVTIGGQTTTTKLGFAPGSTATTGTVACLGLRVYRATPISVTVILVDGSGHPSNSLTITGIVQSVSSPPPR